MGGSREGSGPSLVYTKLSSCRADVAQARTNHPNQLHQHWEHGSQQPGDWARRMCRATQHFPKHRVIQEPPAHPQGCRAERAQSPASSRQDRSQEPDSPREHQVTGPEVGCDTNQRARWMGFHAWSVCWWHLHLFPPPGKPASQAGCSAAPSRVTRCRPCGAHRSSLHKVEQGSSADIHISS